MGAVQKVLGQAAPGAGADTTLYTGEASSQAIVSGLFVCNQGGTEALIRVAIRPNGAVLAAAHYLYYDVALPGNSTATLMAGATFDAADVVTVRTSVATVSFTLCGVVIT